VPNIKSAKKRVLVNQTKNQLNRATISEVKTAIKKFNNAIDTNNIAEAEKLLPMAMSVIDSAVSKGVLHKNNAANKKSNLSKRLSDVKSGKITIVIKKDNKTVAAEKAKAAREAREAIKAENTKKAEERALAKEATGAKDSKKKLTAKETKKAAAIAKDKETEKAEKEAKVAKKTAEKKAAPKAKEETTPKAKTTEKKAPAKKKPESK